jgi:hypothetical protein
MEYKKLKKKLKRPPCRSRAALFLAQGRVKGVLDTIFILYETDNPKDRLSRLY